MSPTAQKQQTARARLLVQMERLFADDAGLGVLVTYNGRPDLTEETKEVQMAWARAHLRFRFRTLEPSTCIVHRV